MDNNAFVQFRVYKYTTTYSISYIGKVLPILVGSGQPQPPLRLKILLSPPNRWKITTTSKVLGRPLYWYVHTNISYTCTTTSYCTEAIHIKGFSNCIKSIMEPQCYNSRKRSAIISSMYCTINQLMVRIHSCCKEIIALGCGPGSIQHSCCILLRPHPRAIISIQHSLRTIN